MINKISENEISSQFIFNVIQTFLEAIIIITTISILVENLGFYEYGKLQAELNIISMISLIDFGLAPIFLSSIIKLQKKTIHRIYQPTFLLVDTISVLIIYSLILLLIFFETSTLIYISFAVYGIVLFRSNFSFNLLIGIKKINHAYYCKIIPQIFCILFLCSSLYFDLDYLIVISLAYLIRSLIEESYFFFTIRFKFGFKRKPSIRLLNYHLIKILPMVGQFGFLKISSICLDRLYLYVFSQFIYSELLGVLAIMNRSMVFIEKCMLLIWSSSLSYLIRANKGENYQVTIHIINKFIEFIFLVYLLVHSILIYVSESYFNNNQDYILSIPLILSFISLVSIIYPGKGLINNNIAKYKFDLFAFVNIKFIFILICSFYLHVELSLIYGYLGFACISLVFLKYSLINYQIPFLLLQIVFCIQSFDLINKHIIFIPLIVFLIIYLVLILKNIIDNFTLKLSNYEKKRILKISF